MRSIPWVVISASIAFVSIILPMKSAIAQSKPCSCKGNVSSECKPRCPDARCLLNGNAPILFYSEALSNTTFSESTACDHQTFGNNTKLILAARYQAYQGNFTSNIELSPLLTGNDFAKLNKETHLRTVLLCPANPIKNVLDEIQKLLAEQRSSGFFARFVPAICLDFNNNAQIEIVKKAAEREVIITDNPILIDKGIADVSIRFNLPVDKLKSNSVGDWQRTYIIQKNEINNENDFFAKIKLLAKEKAASK